MVSEMESQDLEVTRIFTVGGEDADLKMQCLVAYARTLGGFAVGEISNEVKRLETGMETAAEYLRILLSQPGPYRERWATHVNKSRKAGISQAAVAHVLAEWLQTSEGNIEGHIPEARQLKDRVYRALMGKYLTFETLQWFISAFGFTEDETNRLRAYHTHSLDIDTLQE